MYWLIVGVLIIGGILNLTIPEGMMFLSGLRRRNTSVAHVLARDEEEEEENIKVIGKIMLGAAAFLIILSTLSLFSGGGIKKFKAQLSNGELSKITMNEGEVELSFDEVVIEELKKMKKYASVKTSGGVTGYSGAHQSGVIYLEFEGGKGYYLFYEGDRFELRDGEKAYYVNIPRLYREIKMHKSNE